MELSGKVVLVTGAARRLGRLIALTLAAEGADIVLHVHTSSGENLAREIAALGRQVWVVRADLSRRVETHRLSTMQKRGMGKIIQLGDWSGMRPLAGYLPYCVSKRGLAAVTQVLAKAFAPQVQVNAVAPGPVLPPDHYTAAARRALIARTPLRRLGQGIDVARAVRFLVTGRDFVTGSVYLVDGGWLVSEPEGTTTSL